MTENSNNRHTKATVTLDALAGLPPKALLGALAKQDVIAKFDVLDGGYVMALVVVPPEQWARTDHLAGPGGSS